MWLLILIVFAIVLGGVLALLGAGIFGILAVPIALLVAGGILAAVMTRRGKASPQLVRAPREPTGTPRGTSGDAETANERVGQES
jgi:hypothetical protein